MKANYFFKNTHFGFRAVFAFILIFPLVSCATSYRILGENSLKVDTCAMFTADQMSALSGLKISKVGYEITIHNCVFEENAFARIHLMAEKSAINKRTSINSIETLKAKRDEEFRFKEKHQSQLRINNLKMINDLSYPAMIYNVELNASETVMASHFKIFVKDLEFFLFIQAPKKGFDVKKLEAISIKLGKEIITKIEEDKVQYLK